MKLGLDEYIHLESPLHRWDPRYKLAGLMALILAFSFVRDLHMLPPMVAVTAAVYLVSGLPLSFMLRRLRYPSIFVLAAVLILPFLAGQTIVLSVGPFHIRQEGLLAVLLIVIRFLCILTIGLILFGTAPFLTSIKAMRALGLPAILADMLLLSSRYLHEIANDLQRMHTSMTLRGFHRHRLSPRGLRTLAWLGGSILVRSYEQSDWVYKAMILRGYGHELHPRGEFRACSRDVVALSAFLSTAVAFVAVDILWRHGPAVLPW